MRGFFPSTRRIRIALVRLVAFVLAVTAPVMGVGPQAVRVGVSGNIPKPPVSLPHPRAGHALDHQIEKILSPGDLRRGFWGIEVVQDEGGRVLYARHGDHLFVPASNLKLFTTAAALEKLGPDYVFHTTVESDAAPDAQGRVGDLYLVGRGDPDLGARRFPYSYRSLPQPPDTFIQEMADQLQARGVREITGKLIADDRYFLWEPFAPNWAVDDVAWGYGAPVSALAFDDNSLTLHVLPGEKVGDAAWVRVEPVPDYYLLRNALQTSAAGTEKNYLLQRQPGSMEIHVWGQIPADAHEDVATIAIADPPRLIIEKFSAALRTRGIVVNNECEVLHRTHVDAPSPPSPTPRVVLAEHQSPPLSQIIKVINKESENLHAEMLLRTLGRVTQNEGSREGGIKALNAFAAQAGISPGELHASDGSGLSRDNLVTPSAITQLLSFMGKSPRFPVYLDSLPVAGVDGTLVHRFAESAVKGRIHAKTGSLEHVNTLSGYMVLPTGKRLAFAILANNQDGSNQSCQPVLDALAMEIYQWFSARH